MYLCWDPRLSDHRRLIGLSRTHVCNDSPRPHPVPSTTMEEFQTRSEEAAISSICPPSNWDRRQVCCNINTINSLADPISLLLQGVGADVDDDLPPS